MRTRGFVLRGTKILEFEFGGNTEHEIFHIQELGKKEKLKGVFKDLVETQQSKEKGKAVKYKNFQIADYLLPEANINISDKLEIFA